MRKSGGAGEREGGREEAEVDEVLRKDGVMESQ